MSHKNLCLAKVESMFLNSGIHQKLRLKKSIQDQLLGFSHLIFSSSPTILLKIVSGAVKEKAVKDFISALLFSVLCK
jgi:hypothetical protein